MTTQTKNSPSSSQALTDKDKARRRRVGGSRPVREKREFDQKIIEIRRVTRVVAGGRRFSFSVAVVLGDRNGRVGVGLGKSSDTSLAIAKAVRDAEKNMIRVNITKDASIPFATEAKFCASRVMIKPAAALIAGGAVRNVLELAGVKGANAKILSRSKNKLNNARAAIEALRLIGADK